MLPEELSSPDLAVLAKMAPALVGRRLEREEVRGDGKLILFSDSLLL
jgi:hypothetical protein